MSDPTPAPVYTIAAVSKLTGVSCHALRVWERRYGFPVPGRSAKGHRRYDREDVALLSAIGSRIRAGRPVRDALEEARAIARPFESESATQSNPSRGGTELLDAECSDLLGRLLSGDLDGAEAIHRRSALEMAPRELVARLLEPALVEAGESYFRGDCGLAAERQATQFLMRKLTVVLDAAKTANGEPKGRVLVGCPRGDRHEGGPMLVAVALELSGWRSIPLGADLPTSDFQAAIDAWRPDALAVSFVLSRNVRRRFAELSRLRGTPVFVGGRSIVNYQSLAIRHGMVPLAGRAFPAVEAMLSRLTRVTGETGTPNPSRVR